MRSVEFIVEDLESLTAFLALTGINLPLWESESESAITSYNNGDISFSVMEEELYQINVAIRNAMINLQLWQRVGDDPDWKIFYQNMSKLSQRNSDVMDKRKP